MMKRYATLGIRASSTKGPIWVAINYAQQRLGKSPGRSFGYGLNTTLALSYLTCPSHIFLFFVLLFFPDLLFQFCNSFSYFANSSACLLLLLHFNAM
jgi:hypothetical protein